MDENEEEKRISRIEGIMEQRKDLNYDFDRARKRIELTDFLSEHKKDFITWLKEEGYDVEKIQYITNGDYREHHRLHKSFSKYYLEKQKAKYKNLLEESLGDTEKYNNVLMVILHKKNKNESLRIFTSSLQPEELEQMGIVSTEKYLRAETFHSLYALFADLLSEHKLNCQKIPNEWRPEIFQIRPDNKDEVKQENTLVLKEPKDEVKQKDNLILRNLADSTLVTYEDNQYKLNDTMPKFCSWLQENGYGDITAEFIHKHITTDCKLETIKRYIRTAKKRNRINPA